jgi:hypothetical protein
VKAADAQPFGLDMADKRKDRHKAAKAKYFIRASTAWKVVRLENRKKITVAVTETEAEAKRLVRALEKEERDNNN